MPESRLELLRRKLAEAQRELDEAVENHESAKVLNHYSQVIRNLRQSITKLENKENQ